LDLGSSPTALDLRAEGIRTVLWATGYARNYSWLKVPVLDETGEVLHDGGVTPSPGLYVLGLNFLRRRRSHFIDGVGLDAEDLARHIDCYVSRSHRAAA
jgi:putative flavoprotein involved in K+ transport